MRFDKRPVKYCILLFFFIAVTKADGQDTGRVNPPDSGRSLRKQAGKRWVVPVSLAIGYTAGTYLCYRFGDARIREESQEHKTKFKTGLSNAVTNLGLGKYQAIAAGGTAIFALAVKDEKLQKTVIIWGGSLLINSVITDQLKKTFQRHRPNSGDPYNSFDWRKGPKINTSFPSAHTSNIFTTAAVFATLYKNNKWVPPVAYTLASLVGLSRIYDDAHWVSDVLAGAALGFLSAKAMNALYNLAGKKIAFLPQVTTGYCAIGLICQF